MQQGHFFEANTPLILSVASLKLRHRRLDTQVSEVEKLQNSSINRSMKVSDQ